MKQFILIIIAAIFTFAYCSNQTEKSKDPVEVHYYPSKSDVIYAEYTYPECIKIIDSLSSVDWGKWYAKNNIKNWDKTVGYGSKIYDVKETLKYYKWYLSDRNQFNPELERLLYDAEWLSDSIRTKRDSVMSIKYPKEYKRYKEAVSSFVEETKYSAMQALENKHEKPKKYKTSVSYTPYGTVVTITEK